MYKHKVYWIETLTNTHVGSGDTNFGTVDNLIQKDTITSLPVFHSSSIKGSIKEHMEQYKESEIPETDLNLIFGEEENKPGIVRFYDVRLLTLPLRASKHVFYHCTSPETILDYLNCIGTFCKITGLDELKNFLDDTLNLTDKEFAILDSESDLEIEDYTHYETLSADNTVKELIQKYIGVDWKNIAVFKNEIFADICRESLPVVARNRIGKDGTSENLFYEEILPRRSKLWFMVGFEKDKAINEKFEEKLRKDLIQAGGNASIGYGVTKISFVGGES